MGRSASPPGPRARGADRAVRGLHASGGGAGRRETAPACGVARAYRQAMLERRRLLADTPAKDCRARAVGAGRAATRTAPSCSPRASPPPSGLARCWAAAASGPAVMHSRLAPGRRGERAAALRRRRARTCSSAPRVLDEGVDVPAADLAVIVGASRSRRQMIQRMGRSPAPQARRSPRPLRRALRRGHGRRPSPRCPRGLPRRDRRRRRSGVVFLRGGDSQPLWRRARGCPAMT